MSFSGKSIVIGVTGSIAAFKAAALVSQLVQQGAHVQVVMTEAAKQFVTPLTFETLSRETVLVDLFSREVGGGIRHIQLSRAANLIVVAPATANILGKVAGGIADDLLTTTILAAQVPVLFAPAMNPVMYAHPAVQANVKRLREMGYGFIEPGVGVMACGEVGEGRLADLDEILSVIAFCLTRNKPPYRDYASYRLLVTAGPTTEPIDPVRYVGNRSSGKMGYAFAREATYRGAQVTLVSGPVSLPVPPGVTPIFVKTTEEMAAEVLKQAPGHDAIVMAAAPVDYRPRDFSAEKIHKGSALWQLELAQNPDILTTLSSLRGGVGKKPILVGFAAETSELEARAEEKLRKKQLDLIVANPVLETGAGFESDTNRVTMIHRDGSVERLEKMPKPQVASRLLDVMLPYLADSRKPQ